METPLFLLQPLTVECETWIETHVEYNEKIGGALALDFFVLLGVLEVLRENGFSAGDDFSIIG